MLHWRKRERKKTGKERGREKRGDWDRVGGEGGKEKREGGGRTGGKEREEGREREE